MRRVEADTDPRTPGFETVETVSMDARGWPVEGRTETGAGALLSQTAYVREGNSVRRERDDGADGSTDYIERRESVFDALGRLTQYTRDEGDDGNIESRLRFSYEGSSRHIVRRDNESFVMGVPSNPSSYCSYAYDAEDRVERMVFHWSDATTDTATFVYEDAVSASAFVINIDFGSDDSVDIRIRIAFEGECSLDARPQDTLI